MAVYRGKTDVSNLVGFVETLQNDFSKFGSRDFAVGAAFHDSLIFDIVEDIFFCVIRDRTLFKSALDSLFEFCTVIRLSASVPFYDHERLFFDSFVTCEPESAADTFTAAAD